MAGALPIVGHGASSSGGAVAMPRPATGGAFESRGKLFARVTVAPKRRRAVLVAKCRTLGEAEARAQHIQELVDRLREAGHPRGVDAVLSAAGTQDDAGMRNFAKVVARVIAGKEPAPWDRPAPRVEGTG